MLGYQVVTYQVVRQSGGGIGRRALATRLLNTLKWKEV